jgi:hypothetical protein
MAYIFISLLAAIPLSETFANYKFRKPIKLVILTGYYSSAYGILIIDILIPNEILKM